MWFNEDDDFDEGEAVVPATNSSLINKKLNNELEAIGSYTRCVAVIADWTSFLWFRCVLGKNIDKKADANNAARLFGNNTKTSPTMNNNLAATGALSVTQVDNKCSVSLFKKVGVVKYIIM